MLRKEDIIKKLDTDLFRGKDYWVLTGSAMVLYGIKEETKDIDMGASSKFIDELIALGYDYSFTPDGERKICFDDFEIFENWLCGEVNVVDNIPVISLNGLIELKAQLGREKDFKDIEMIKKHIEERS